MFDAKKYLYDRHHRLKSEHKCVVCGEQLEESIKDTQCEFCRAKSKIAEQKCYQKRKLRRGTMLLFRARKALAELYKKWINKNNIKDCPESVIGFLCGNDLINVEKAKAFIEKGGTE